jgi:rhamnosyltransferase
VKLVAGIVTFNPDPTRLRENLAAVFADVSRVVVVDNSSTDRSVLNEIAMEFEELDLLCNDVNRGIACALNQIAEWAIAEGAEWVLLLDQDSVCSPGMIASLRSVAGNGIALVVPEIVDRNLKEASGAPSEVVDVDYAITSGAVANLDVWRSLGGYDEAFFIDYVDFDYCLRVRSEGFRIVRRTEAVLLHEIGSSRRHGRVVAYNHSAFRSYYMARDMLFYARKHRRSSKSLKVAGRGTAATYVVLLRKALIVAIYEEDRWNRVGALIRGTAAETLHRRESSRG